MFDSHIVTVFFAPLYFIPHAEKLETAQIWRSDYGVRIWETLLKAYSHNPDHQKIIALYQAKYEDKIAEYNAKIIAEDKAVAEQAAAKANNLSGLLIDASADVDGLMAAAERTPGLRGRRLADLLGIWKTTGSSFQVERALDTDKELYEHSVQSSYLLARVLVWAIPIFGFVGTVGGISHAVGAFDKVLNSAENVEALREGLVQVTGGLSKAFHTTSLGLVLSVIVMLPITYLEKTEQEILGTVDTDLRFKLLALTPPEDGFSEVEEASMSKLITDAFERHLPDPSVLVEPARISADRLTEGTLERLEPLRLMARESMEGIAEARLSIQDQVDVLRSQLDGLGGDLKTSMQALAPVMNRLSSVADRAAHAADAMEQQQDLEELRTSVGELLGLFRQLERSQETLSASNGDGGAANGAHPLTTVLARLQALLGRGG